MTTAIKPEVIVGDALEEYARRGVFRGFARGAVKRGVSPFRMMWHRDRLFDVLFDPAKASLRVPVVLPDVDAKSPMYKELKTFLKGCADESLPEHRRFDPARVEIKPLNRGGNVSITIKSLDGDLEYASRKLVNLVNEIYVGFLYDGPWYDYMVEAFDLDPDWP